MKKDAEDERTRVKEAARERVLEEFEKGQLGLAIAQTTAGGTKSGGNADERESYESFPQYMFI
jgi:nitric oxide synthase-interacting protein